MSIPQMKSIYKANSNTFQPCAPAPVSVFISLAAKCHQSAFSGWCRVCRMAHWQMISTPLSSCMQASAVSDNVECNIMGARTNNRVLHNLNGRTIFLANPGLSGQ